MGEPERSKFDTVARQYAAGRPNYPAELFDAIGAALPRAWPETTVLDVAAGTGIATRQLAERAGRVLAVELSEPMLAELLAASPGIHAVRGSGNALPVRDAAADLVTFAQAFHWMDPARSIPEVLRVLRPGGVLAMWWNQTDRTSQWEAEQEQRLAVVTPDWRRSGISEEAHTNLDAEFGLRVTEQVFEWRREITVEEHLLNLVSKSYIAALPDREAFIDTERRLLLETFPSGQLTERFQTLLVLVER